MRNVIFLGIFGLCLISQALWAGSSGSPEKDTEESWNSRMVELKELTRRLVPAVFSLTEFERVKNDESLEKDIKRFSELTHKVNVKANSKDSKLPTSDPSLRFVSELLQENSQRAYSAFKSGQKEYARGLIRQSLGFCFSCHTTGRFGPRFDDKEEAAVLKGLGDLDKADFYVATRRFDKAYGLYESAVANKKNVENIPLEWQRGLRNALALTVRVQNNSQAAKKLLATAESVTQKGDQMYSEDIRAWKKGVELWSVEQKRYVDPGSETKHIELIRRLASSAEKRKKYPADRSAEVENLRLSASCHEFLQMYPDSKLSAEVLYYLGVAYDSLRGLGGQWMLQDAYWEACIFAQPNSKMSWKCYMKYRDSVHLEHSGSRGTEIPTYLRFKLFELRRFANTK